MRCSSPILINNWKSWPILRMRKRKNYLAELKSWKENLENSYALIKEHIDDFTRNLIITHKENFSVEANKRIFKTYIFKSRSNNLVIEDLKKSLNTPNKVLAIKQELNIL